MATTKTICEASDGQVHLRNARLALAWDSITLNLGALADVPSGHNFIAATPIPTWRLELSDGAAITPADAANFTWQPLTLPDGAGVAMQWQGFPPAGQPQLRVEARITLGHDEGISRWWLGLDGLSDAPTLKEVRFPQIADLQRTPGQEMLALPNGGGRLITEPRREMGQAGEVCLVYPGNLTMQCMGLYTTDGPGLYVATDDGDGYRKGFCWQGNAESDRLSLSLTHLPPLPLPPEGAYGMPYHAVLGTFQGDWLTVAEIYRPWALAQRWSQKSRLRQGLVPQWLRETVLWLWNRGQSSNVVPGALTLGEETDVPVSVLWHWWHGCAYDAGFPEYLPPREGAEPFKEAVSRLRQAGIHPFPYVNGRLWGLWTESWEDEGALRGAAHRANGSLYREVYNTFTRSPMIAMCPASSLWQEKISSILGALANDLDTPGIYLDQVAIASPAPCYNEEHGHPLGGGNHWVTGYHEMMQNVRDRIGDGSIAVATEGCGETYLDSFDVFLVLDPSVERYSRDHAARFNQEAIPLFQSVYHGVTLTFGSYTSLTEPPYDEKWPYETMPAEPLKLLDRRFSRQFRLELARQLTWGSQLMVANVRPEHFEVRAEELAFVRQLARLAQRAAKYLRDGTFLRPPPFNTPSITLPFITLSIYVRSEREVVHQRTVPAVLGSAWQAPDGDIGVVLVNISDEDQKVDLALHPSEQWGTADPWQTQILSADDVEMTAGPFRGSHSLPVELPAESARIVEITTERSAETV